MMHLIDVTIDCSKETAEAYEVGRPEGEKPLKFPLRGCVFTHNGSRASISVRVPGQRNQLIDRLIRCDEPAQAGRTADAWTVSGQSEHLYRMGISPEDAEVTFTIRADKKSAVQGSGA